MSDLKVTHDFGLIDHIKALDERVGKLEMAAGITPTESVYTECWDKGFAGEGDPYGIQAEYVSQSFNPYAVIPTQAEADAAAASE